MTGYRHYDVGVFYCIAHEGVANEDMDRCDFFDPDTDGHEDEAGDWIEDACDFRRCRIQRSPTAKVDR